MLTLRTIRPVSSGLSDQGSVRRDNQDAWLADDHCGLYAVADGMGGRRAGGVASRLALALLPRLIEGQKRLTVGRMRDAICELNARVRQQGESRNSWNGMGCTLACLAVRGSSACIANMGDSRVYRLQKGRLSCLTLDHTLAALLSREGLLPAGADASHPGRNRLTRYVGMEGDVFPDVMRVRLADGDKFLLCTDGLWNVLAEDRLAEMLGRDEDPGQVCQALVEEANRMGSRDNITAVVVACGKVDAFRFR